MNRTVGCFEIRWDCYENSDYEAAIKTAQLIKNPVFDQIKEQFLVNCGGYIYGTTTDYIKRN